MSWERLAAALWLSAVAASPWIALANCLLALAGLAWCVARVRGETRPATSALMLPLALYALASLASAALSPRPMESLAEMGDLLTLLLVPMTVSLMDPRRWERLVVLLALVSLASSATGLGQWMAGASSLEDRIHGLANHYTTFAAWTVLALLAVLGHVLFDPSRRSRTWAVPSVLVAAGALTLSLSRGAWLSVAVGLVIAAAIRRPAAALVAPMLALALVPVTPAPVATRALSLVDPADPSIRERLCMLEAGRSMIREHPLVGQGLGRVDPAYREHRGARSMRERVPHLHNNFVQIAAERGLPAAGAYILLLAVFAIRVTHRWRRGDRAERPMLAGCVLAMAGITVAGLFDYTWGDAEVWIPTLVCFAAPFAGGRQPWR